MSLKQELGFHGVKMGKCGRCGKYAELYPSTVTDNEGETRKMNVCGDCDFTIINGRGDPFDASEDFDDEEEFG